MSEKIRELLAQEELGNQARKFLESDLGKVLIGFAQQDADEAKEALATVDPTDIEKIRALQNRALFAVLFEGWLKELIVDGENSLSELQQIKQES